MSDEVDTPSTDTTAASEAPQNASQSQQELPDWARQQISQANQEAAARRVQLREAEKEAQALRDQLATVTSERDNLASSSSTVQTDFDKLATAVQSLLPDKHSQIFTFAKTLQGTTEEELANHAAELNQMFGISAGPSPAVDRSQGLGTGAPAADPASLLAEFIKPNLTR